jgi:hypothetical protein
MGGKALLVSVLRSQLRVLPYSDCLLPLVHSFWAGTCFIPAISTPSIAHVPRFLVGLAAGLGICLCPIYLSEIAPARIKGNLGSRSF